MKVPFNIMALSGSFWGKFTEFFSPELGTYDNLTFNESSFVSLKYIIMGIFFGIILASLSALYNRRVLGKFIRALIKADATSPEKAKTLAELGFERNGFVRTSLRNGCTLKNSTSCVEYDEFLKKMAQKAQKDGAETAQDSSDSTSDAEKNGDARKTDRRALRDRDFIPDLATAHFYILEDKKYAMEIKFEDKGTNWLTFAFAVVASVVLAGAVVMFMPDILRFIDNFINVISGS